MRGELKQKEPPKKGKYRRITMRKQEERKDGEMEIDNKGDRSRREGNNEGRERKVN